MFVKWFPWKYVVRRVARAQGFVDPISVLSRMHAFSEPSEVTAPVELLRAGVVFHARGLMNAGSIQHNRDWIWPYWVERQFDPHDEAFLPRAFSITHVNLTHRNWTAIGIPGCDHLPIVDPRGLLTPHWDGWSIDAWIFRNDGVRLVPSQQRVIEQELRINDGLAVATECGHGGMQLQSVAEVVKDSSQKDTVSQQWVASCDKPAWLVLSLRPYNPEGVSFVHDVRLNSDRRGWQIGEHGTAVFSQAPDQHFTSDYKHGDVAAQIWKDESASVHCPVGMATAAAAYELEPGVPREIVINVPLDDNQHHHWLGRSTTKKSHVPVTGAGHHQCSVRAWESELEGTARVEVPDERFRFLHDAALRTLVLHTPGEVYPGPYTYKRFWVRDTAFILNAALCTGLHARTKAALPHLLDRQDRAGYFHSQEGEWDANGQALWLLERYLRTTNSSISEPWQHALQRATDWIDRKRVADHNSVADGLLPAGFSAEHLGPNDFYYWDDFWSIAGLNAAERLARKSGDTLRATKCQQLSQDISVAIQRSLERTDYMRTTLALPAAPERRLDAGAIGSIVASYPLQLVPPDDPRLQGTLDYLLNECLVEGGFFQDMIHSGINPYLTLHIAQVLLRQGDSRAFELMNTVAKLATPTGQWPEAIHPRTLGGCMGDGQHVWAAAEWLMAIRNIFVREEGEKLVLGAGIPARWHYSDEKICYGPTWTPWGSLRLEIEFRTESARLSWEANWHADAPHAQIAIPCFHHATVELAAPAGECEVAANHTCQAELAR